MCGRHWCTFAFTHLCTFVFVLDACTDFKDIENIKKVGVLGTKIYVCGGTDESWTAHATVEVNNC